MHKAGWKFIKVKGLGTYCFENLKNQKHLLNCFLSLLNLLPNYIVLTKLDIIFTYYPTPPFFTCFVVKIRVKKGGEKQIENNEQTLGEPV